MLSGTLTTDAGVAAWCFTSRADGVSSGPYASNNMAAHVGDEPDAVRANRAQLEAQLGGAALAWMGPVHGVRAAFLEAPAALTPDVDVLATRLRALPLATLGADCVPLLLAVEDVIVAAHVGWRGLADGMTDALVSLLQAQGCDPAQAQVVLGPAICGACYAIPTERALAIEAACPAALCDARAGGVGADIREGLAAQWRDLGARVALVGPCTAESPDYFSHRRDGVTGRQAGVIRWT